MDVAEIERKFDAPPDAVLPRLRAGAYGPAREFALHAVYFDTPGLILLRSGRGTLRRREGGHDEGWHVKLAVRPGERLEVHAPLGPLIPDELRARLADLVGTEPLIPVATLLTRRTETDVLDAAGGIVGTVFRDEVTAEAAGTVTRWAEIEVEAVGAGAAWLDEVTEEFAAAGIHVSSNVSKYAVAVAPLANAPAVAATAGSVIGDYVRLQVGAVQAYAAGVRARTDDAVHKSRVATRRLRSVLRTFAPLFGPLPGLRREVRWHAEELGAVRDAEVLQESLSAFLAEVPAADVHGPVAARILGSLAATHAEARAGLVRSMDTRRYTELRIALRNLAAAPPLTARAAADPDTLVGLVRRTSARVAQAAAAAADDPGNPAGWHDVRKLAKAARYANEAIVPWSGAPAEEAAGRWEAVTELLGTLQDTQVARERLRELAHDAARAGEPTHTYEVLLERERAAGARALAEGRDALAAALEPGLTS
ncbi:CYTH and CHAD domain-containing protein [Propionicicella superfundia]|uniref:CYTH and CHAD domain-containing protein n=1 Tax=Propionicicella superfundia TaxID=348582 RepID=UPI000402DD0F|nr:CYTH and CHAD domain-containing protein [Propionicicella superfundia]